jgi:hypothetical protein
MALETERLFLAAPQGEPRLSPSVSIDFQDRNLLHEA